ncbi:sulfur carrier protein ThiS [Schaalia sp. ZJ405]|uniref:sulfur carrier protein ThiS n=1 Tax=Schaalia sp. ZJ405 TaxID=2709403 RepID=UPI001934F12D|nr:sulfur carrier protein ThiS [Schaalia sp. ZJ405]QPK81414.1 sulfur carrier protein ThiS [Schaalia sp. ZJ405]
MMTLTVNGTVRTTDATTVEELVAEILGYVPDAGFAVALDGAVVPRSQWGRPLRDGHVVDILTAVQGG